MAALFKRSRRWPSSSYTWLALVSTLVIVGTLRAVLTPMGDNQGAFPDEVYHFARSLQEARNIASRLGLRPPMYSEDQLNAITTRASDVCELGLGDQEVCAQRGFASGSEAEQKQSRAVYIMHGLAQLAISTSDTYTRLIFGRLVGVSVSVALACVVYSLGVLLFNDRGIAWAAAAITVLMPSASSIMSSVSSEGPALLSVSFLFWAAALACQRGFSLLRIFSLCLGIVACLFTKVTALFAIPLVTLMLLNRLGFGWRELFLCATFGFAGVVAGLSASLTHAGAAHWYVTRSPWLVSIHGSPARLATVSTIVEEHLLRNIGETYAFTSRPIVPGFEGPINGVVQFLPQEDAARLSGKTLTLGSWVRANPGQQIYSPEVVLAYNSVNQRTLPSKDFRAKGIWQYSAYEVNIPAEVTDIGVLLPWSKNTAGTGVFWDDITLAEGSFESIHAPPIYDLESDIVGSWGGVRFVNLLKNGSAETQWKAIPTATAYLIMRNATLANRFNGQLFMIQDWDRTRSGYMLGMKAIFATFWGSFMGGDVPGLARWHYVIISIVLVLACLGWARRALRSFAEHSGNHSLSMIPLPIATSFAISGLFYVLIGVVRMEVSAEWVPPLFYATGRFVLPVIALAVLLTIAGISQLFPKRPTRVVLALVVAGVYLANTWMLFNVEIPYFECPLEIHWDCTPL